MPCPRIPGPQQVPAVLLPVERGAANVRGFRGGAQSRALVPLSRAPCKLGRWVGSRDGRLSPAIPGMP